ncbi:MAG TPA: hypothetical protein VHX61_13275 [Rhizomicrobium sp.]|nr:hypothetical protein [Rhizomicrobium sp.]
MTTVSIAQLSGIVGCVLVQPVWAAEAGKFTETVVWSFGSEATELILTLI